LVSSHYCRARILIDAGMVLPAILFPMTTITGIEAYASTFNSLQMLSLVLSLLLTPMFVMMMLAIHQLASDDQEFSSQLGFSFALISAAVLSIHHYVQLTLCNRAF